ncbi:hypothetical protein [Bradyrhizobium sp. RT5a]|uniref:hypothetical protein n=1 Tax=unclassified Bradyrhizobium TaxID=2631580 RepID=UPI003393299D
MLQTIATTELAPDAIPAAQQRILAPLGVTFNGLDLPALEVAFRSRSPSVGPCTVIGRDATAAAADAAFVNAVMSHSQKRLFVTADLVGRNASGLPPQILPLRQTERTDLKRSRNRTNRLARVSPRRSEFVKDLRIGAHHPCRAPDPQHEI